VEDSEVRSLPEKKAMIAASSDGPSRSGRARPRAPGRREIDVAKNPRFTMEVRWYKEEEDNL
jgi:hypothetical protein